MEDTARVEHRDHGQADLDCLLTRLDQDRAAAWEKYRDLRRRLVKFFEWSQCTFPEERADEVLDRVARKPKEDEIRDVAEFAIGVARNVRFEIGKRTHREFHFEDLPGGAESLAGPGDLEQEIVGELDQQTSIDSLRNCLESLKAADRTLVLGYYSAEEEKQKVHRQKLANAAGMTMIALRVRTNRLREKLEECVRNSLENRRQSRRIGQHPASPSPPH